MAYTSIQISPETRMKLARLKENDRETYDAVLNKLMSLVPLGDEEGEYTDEFRIGLLNARLDFLQGRAVSHKDAKKMLGL